MLSMKNKKVLYFLPLLLLVGFCVRSDLRQTPPDKAAFFAKHHIAGDTLVPADFDFETYRQVLSQHVYPHDGDKAVRNIREYMVPPELFSGFYPPSEKLFFYNVAFTDNFQALGFDEAEIKKFFPDQPETDDKSADFRLVGLIARVGENIYLTGAYGSCGSFGCPVDLVAKESGQLKRYRADLLFSSCAEVSYRKGSTTPEVFNCDIAGGFDYALRADARFYPPLNDLLNKYHAVYQDYVQQYIQPTKKDLSER